METVLFAILTFSAVMAQQYYAFRAYRRLGDPKWVGFLLWAALISFLMIFAALVLTMVFPFPRT
jgi:hypothetical protein